MPATIWRGLRPYALPLATAAYLPAVLAIDAAGVSSEQQHLLGLLTFVVLAIATRSSGRAERRLVWIAVALWTGVELFASIGWGIYVYRLGNVPLFVPPGHGLVYLCGLHLARSPLVIRHGMALRWGVVLAGGAWAVAGLAVLPLFTGRIDFAGAALWPVLSVCVLASRSGMFYAAIFVVASLLEITGTSLGVWTWAPVQPVTGFPSGNPPSVVAAAYCVFDLVMLRIALSVARFGRAPQPDAPFAPAPARRA